MPPLSRKTVPFTPGHRPRRRASLQPLRGLAFSTLSARGLPPQGSLPGPWPGWPQAVGLHGLSRCCEPQLQVKKPRPWRWRYFPGRTAGGGGAGGQPGPACAICLPRPRPPTGRAGSRPLVWAPCLTLRRRLKLGECLLLEAHRGSPGLGGQRLGFAIQLCCGACVERRQTRGLVTTEGGDYREGELRLPSHVKKQQRWLQGLLGGPALQLAPPRGAVALGAREWACRALGTCTPGRLPRAEEPQTQKHKPEERAGTQPCPHPRPTTSLPRLLQGAEDPVSALHTEQPTLSPQTRPSGPSLQELGPAGGLESAPCSLLTQHVAGPQKSPFPAADAPFRGFGRNVLWATPSHLPTQVKGGPGRGRAGSTYTESCAVLAPAPRPPESPCPAGSLAH